MIHIIYLRKPIGILLLISYMGGFCSYGCVSVHFFIHILCRFCFMYSFCPKAITFPVRSVVQQSIRGSNRQCMDNFGFGFSQWGTALQCNVAFCWLNAYPKLSLQYNYYLQCIVQNKTKMNICRILYNYFAAVSYPYLYWAKNLIETITWNC